MTIIGTKREFHGALAKHSPFTRAAVMCVVCSAMVRDAITIKDEICDACYRDGWRAPSDVLPAGARAT